MSATQCHSHRRCDCISHYTDTDGDTDCHWQFGISSHGRKTTVNSMGNVTATTLLLYPRLKLATGSTFRNMLTEHSPNRLRCTGVASEPWLSRDANDVHRPFPQRIIDFRHTITDIRHSGGNNTDLRSWTSSYPGGFLKSVDICLRRWIFNQSNVRFHLHPPYYCNIRWHRRLEAEMVKYSWVEVMKPIYHK